MVEKRVAEISAVAHPNFDEFAATIEALRAVDGCPWDKEQTHQSISHNMIEEAHEAVDAIESHDVAHMCEELGDVLLQVVLQSQIAADAGEFTLDDVCGDVNDKIVRRHPHVFGEATAGSANEVIGLWDKIKVAEKQQADDKAAETDAAAGLLDDVPSSLPALMQAQKISRKAASAGFEWDGIEAVWRKVAEEIDELKATWERATKDPDGKIVRKDDEQAVRQVELEMGDVLFSLVNVARRMGIDAEESLRAACAKFRQRWAFMEDAAREEGRRVEDLDIAELEQAWQAAKQTAE